MNAAGGRRGDAAGSYAAAGDGADPAKGYSIRSSGRSASDRDYDRAVQVVLGHAHRRGTVRRRRVHRRRASVDAGARCARDARSGSPPSCASAGPAAGRLSGAERSSRRRRPAPLNASGVAQVSVERRSADAAGWLSRRPEVAAAGPRERLQRHRTCLGTAGRDGAPLERSRATPLRPRRLRPRRVRPLRQHRLELEAADADAHHRRAGARRRLPLRWSPELPKRRLLDWRRRERRATTPRASRRRRTPARLHRRTSPGTSNDATTMRESTAATWTQVVAERVGDTPIRSGSRTSPSAPLVQRPSLAAASAGYIGRDELGLVRTIAAAVGELIRVPPPTAPRSAGSSRPPHRRPGPRNTATQHRRLGDRPAQLHHHSLFEPALKRARPDDLQHPARGSPPAELPQGPGALSISRL